MQKQLFVPAPDFKPWWLLLSGFATSSAAFVPGLTFAFCALFPAIAHQDAEGKMAKLINQKVWPP